MKKFLNYLINNKFFNNLKLRPIPTLRHFFWGLFKSLAFMASYVAVLRYFLCFTKNTRGKIDGKFTY